MAVTVDSRNIWPLQQTVYPYHIHPAIYHPYHVIPPKNTRELNRETLISVLEYMSTLLEAEFGGLPIRVVAHGGACMLLHPGLYNLATRKAAYHSDRGENVSTRKTTRDVDYIRRSFLAEYVGKHKIMDADFRMQKCIRATALKFGLGADWMNADADVALPMSSHDGVAYDPIYKASLQPFNVRLYTVFTSKNKKLTIINVTPAWAVALKLVRYAKWDPGDICLLLMNGTNLAKVHWTTKIIRTWITDECAAMGYDRWEVTKLLDMQKKIEHAVQMVTSIGTNLAVGRLTSTNGPPAASRPIVKQPEDTSIFIPPEPLVPSSSSRPLGPSASLDSQSNAWIPPLPLEETSRKKKKTKHRESHRHESQPPLDEVTGFTSSFHLQALQQALPDPSNTLRRTQSTEFDDRTTSQPFIPTFPDGHASHVKTTKQRRPDKHADRRKDKQRRDRERDRDRRSKREGMDGSTYNPPLRNFDNYLPEDLLNEPYTSGSDTDSDSDHHESRQPEHWRYSRGNARGGALRQHSPDGFEYVPMPQPPTNAHIPHAQERRQQQPEGWREGHSETRMVSPSPSDNVRQRQISPHLPTSNVRQNLMWSIYSPAQTGLHPQSVSPHQYG